MYLYYKYEKYKKNNLYNIKIKQYYNIQVYTYRII